MSCRTTAAGSCFTTYARLVTGGRLSDVATLSLFHELRRSYNEQPVANRRVRTQAEYLELLNRQQTRIQGMQNITDARRQSLLERISRAHTEEMPDQSVIHALYNITPQVRARIENLERFLVDMAARLNQPLEEVRTQFNDSIIVGSRRTLSLESYSQADRDTVSQYGLGQEVGICHAVSLLNDQARAVEATRITEGVSRIIRKPIVEARSRETGVDNLFLTEAGYDIRNQRLEVSILDTTTGIETVYAYKVQEYYANQVADLGYRNNGKIWYNTIRGNMGFAYSSQEEEIAAGIAPRCLACGQFAASGHGCPMRVEPQIMSRYSTRSRWSRQRLGMDVGDARGNTAISLPAITEFRTALATGAVTVNGISEYIYLSDNRGGARVSGSVTAYKDENDACKINISNLYCQCNNYLQTGSCSHVEAIKQAVYLRLNPVRTVRTASTPEERLAIIAVNEERARVAAATDWTLQEATFSEARRTWRGNSEVLYSEDFDAFERVYEASVKARKDNENKPVIPYIRENALDGMATRESGQGFGVEIEYEFLSGVDRRTANINIGRAFLAAGLTPDATQRGYHFAKSRGYRDTHVDSEGKGNWSWENDGSVSGGELVSPTMYDEPETWEKLEKAIKILTDNGAIATKKAGGHVHVGTGFYHGSPEKYTELARLMTQHEDVMFRLAANPTRGTHRMSSYASPPPAVPALGFANIAAVQRGTGGRSALNYISVAGNMTDHPEFRIFDSSLDAGAIQSHIKLSVAMTHAAARIASAGGSTRTKEVLGSHVNRAKVRGTRKLTKNDLKEETTTFRSLLDTLFRRAEDKAQLTAVFANTKWSKQRGR